MIDLQAFQNGIGLRFVDTALLQQALTHRSYVNEHEDVDLVDNERLEFLGDAVLDFISGDLLFRRFPEALEGELTRLRAALVRTESLAELGRLCQVGEALRMGKGEENSGGRERLNNLCGAFEAVMGALYVDQGLESVRTFVTPLLLRRLEVIIAEQLDKDPRSVLQERSQYQYSKTPQYRFVESSGPEHEKAFTFEVLIGDWVAGRGVGRSKQAAAHAAAYDALSRMDKPSPTGKPEE